MYPRLIELGPLTIYSYGVLLAAAYLLGLKLAMVRAKARKPRCGAHPRPRHLHHHQRPDRREAPVARHGLQCLSKRSRASCSTLARSGGVFYGGLIFAVAVALTYIRRKGLPLWTTCDVFAPGIALGHAIGRFGCFFAGCCYGKPSSLPWAITFHDSFAAANVGTPLDVPLHPTQLYEAGAELLILVVLLLTEKRGKPFAGRTFWLYILLYAISRYVIEMFRGDPRGTVFIFSTSQFISILLAPLAVVMLVYLARGEAPTPKTARKLAA